MVANPYVYTDKASDFVQEASTLQAAARQDADDASIPISHIDGQYAPCPWFWAQPPWPVRHRTGIAFRVAERKPGRSPAHEDTKPPCLLTWRRSVQACWLRSACLAQG